MSCFSFSNVKCHFTLSTSGNISLAISSAISTARCKLRPGPPSSPHCHSYRYPKRKGLITNWPQSSALLNRVGSSALWKHKGVKFEAIPQDRSEVFFLTPQKYLSAVKVPGPDTMPRNPSDGRVSDDTRVFVELLLKAKWREGVADGGNERGSINTKPCL